MRLRLPVPICFLDFHRPERRRARWDGEGYAGTCRACGAPIRRGRYGRWRRVAP